MKKALILVALCLSTCALTACGDSSESDSSASLSYNFTVNDCPTGSHTFTNQQDYCDALMNESLNNGCATQMRCETFKARCDSSVDCTWVP